MQPPKRRPSLIDMRKELARLRRVRQRLTACVANTPIEDRFKAVWLWIVERAWEQASAEQVNAYYLSLAGYRVGRLCDRVHHHVRNACLNAGAQAPTGDSDVRAASCLRSFRLSQAARHPQAGEAAGQGG